MRRQNRPTLVRSRPDRTIIRRRREPTTFRESDNSKRTATRWRCRRKWRQRFAADRDAGRLQAPPRRRHCRSNVIDKF